MVNVMLADSADAIASMLHTGYLMVQDPSEARAGVVASSVYCSTCSCCFDYSQALFHGGDIYSGTCMQWQQTQYKENYRQDCYPVYLGSHLHAGAQRKQ